MAAPMTPALSPSAPRTTSRRGEASRRICRGAWLLAIRCAGNGGNRKPRHLVAAVWACGSADGCALSRPRRSKWHTPAYFGRRLRSTRPGAPAAHFSAATPFTRPARFDDAGPNHVAAIQLPGFVAQRRHRRRSPVGGAAMTWPRFPATLSVHQRVDLRPPPILSEPDEYAVGSSSIRWRTGPASAIVVVGQPRFQAEP